MAAQLPDAARGWGTIAIRSACERRLATAALVSYDARNRMLVWRPGPAIGAPAACDIESYDRPPPPACRALLKHVSRVDFLAAWTATEVVAKILRVPMMTWIKAHGLVPCRPRQTLEYPRGRERILLRNTVVPRFRAVITIGYAARKDH